MARTSGAAFSRRARRTGIRLVRRSGLLPSSFPDRLGDDKRLAGTTLGQTVMLYFPDTRDRVYQLRQWYAPLRALDQRHSVIAVFQDSRTAALWREESGLPGITVARYGLLDELLTGSAVKLALYVNHTPQNFTALRFPSLAHVYLSHGDSDKGVSVSNQVKAYDFCFVAGQAAIDRLATHLMFADPAAWCLPIGRPQLDAVPMPPAGVGRPGRPTVLYAPTWEGAQPSMAYGSMATHGVTAVTALLASGRVAVLLRPHPLSGSADVAYGRAVAAVRSLVADAMSREPEAGHRIDTDQPLEASFAGADVLLCDVSSVAMEWLATGKPLVVTEQASTQVATASTRLLSVVPRLAARDAPGVADLVSLVLESDPGSDQRLALVEYYLGDTTPGASTQRFLDACTRVIGLRDEEWAAVAARRSS